MHPAKFVIGMTATMAGSVQSQAQSITPCCSAPEISISAQCAEHSERCFNLGESMVTLSGELRTRAEFISAVNFGLAGAPRSESIAARALLVADIRLPKQKRVFLQMSYAQQEGRRPIPRPFEPGPPRSNRPGYHLERFPEDQFILSLCIELPDDSFSAKAKLVIERACTFIFCQ